MKPLGTVVKIQVFHTDTAAIWAAQSGHFYKAGTQTSNINKTTGVAQHKLAGEPEHTK